MCFSFFRDDSGAEGEERQLCHFEALQTEGNADDGDAENDSRDQVTEGKLDAAEEKPKDVDDDGACFLAVNDLFPKGRESETGHFEALHADGDADDRHAPNNADDEPRECEPKAAKNDPKKITEQFHKIDPFCRKFQRNMGVER